MSVSDERVCLAFDSEGRHRAVPGDKAHVVAQGEQAFTNRLQQLAVAAARKVGASDRTPKEHVAHLGESPFGVKEYDVARGVSRAVNDGEVVTAEPDAVTVLKPAARVERLQRRKREHLALNGNTAKEEFIVLMRSLDRHAEPLCEIPRGAEKL